MRKEIWQSRKERGEISRTAYDLLDVERNPTLLAVEKLAVRMLLRDVSVKPSSVVDDVEFGGISSRVVSGMRHVVRAADGEGKQSVVSMAKSVHMKWKSLTTLRAPVMVAGRSVAGNFGQVIERVVVDGGNCFERSLVFSFMAQAFYPESVIAAGMLGWSTNLWPMGIDRHFYMFLRTKEGEEYKDRVITHFGELDASLASEATNHKRLQVYDKLDLLVDAVDSGVWVTG